MDKFFLSFSSETSVFLSILLSRKVKIRMHKTSTSSRSSPGIWLISFTGFTKPKNAEQHYAQSSDTVFHPNRTINAESTDWNSFTPPRLSMTFTELTSYTSWLLNKLLWTPPVQDFIQIEQKIWKIGRSVIFALWQSRPSTELILTKLIIYQGYCESSVGRDSSVGIAIRYGLDGPGIECRWGARFSAPVQTGPAAHPTSCTIGTGSFPG